LRSPSRIEFLIAQNREALGLTVPAALLARADMVIE
jgi:hypothetical protein